MARDRPGSAGHHHGMGNTVSPVLLLRTAVLALAIGGAATTASCLMCNDIACSGGFEWEARPIEGGAMRPGSYRLAIELEGDSYEFDCTVTERFRESECVRSNADTDDEFELAIDLSSFQSTEEWDRDAPAGSFFVQAWVFEGKDDRSTRGPRDVEILLERDGDALVDAVYAIDYDRDEDFAGDERCGFCDELESRVEEWAED